MASDFLRRWSRLKRERAAESPRGPAQGKPVEKAPETAALPPVEKLTPESDFTSFMQPKVEDAMRRVALKKLFSDPHFNIPDAFEPFSGDWNVAEPISPEMLATLNQAKVMLFDKRDEEPKNEEEKAEEKVEEKKPDEPGRQDAQDLQLQQDHGARRKALASALKLRQPMQIHTELCRKRGRSVPGGAR